MIHTIRSVAVGDQESKIDSPIILYRGDREVEVEFTINGSKFTFTNGGNVIKSTNATHGQLVINTPTGENMFSEVTECHDGKVVFVITKEMIDQIIEIGFYSFQIRLFDEGQVSRITIPPVLKGIDIRNPIAAEDEGGVVDYAIVEYGTVVRDEFENLSTFLPDGNYNKTEWAHKDVVTAPKLNKIEDAIYEINENMESSDMALLNRVENVDQYVRQEIATMSYELENKVEEFDRELNNNIERFNIDIIRLDDEIKFLDDEKNNQVRYFTPKMFGAVGDGVVDDTDALRAAIYESHITGRVLFFPNDCKCRVSGPLNYYNGGYYSPVLNMRGVLPTGKWEYSLSKYGGVTVQNNTNIFQGATITGEISNISFTGIRNEDLHFFDNCLLSSIYIHGCNITNFGAFLYDTGLSGVSRIDRNTFLTNFYFHRYGGKATSITDSYITNNYINGGVEPTNNACFEFQDGNGSTIQGNFIDYYKVIYRPKPQATVEFPASIGNQYQVFLYLYEVTHGGTFKFSSVNDTFNWTDETKLEKLRTYEKSTYTGRDGLTYEIPSHIVSVRYSSAVSFKNAYIQSNVSTVIFYRTYYGEYRYFNYDLDFAGVSKRDKRVKLLKGANAPYYIVGDYDHNTCDSWFIESVDELPQISTPWNSRPIGYKVRYESQDYKLLYKKDPSSGNRTLQWVPIDEG